MYIDIQIDTRALSVPQILFWRRDQHSLDCFWSSVVLSDLKQNKADSDQCQDLSMDWVWNGAWVVSTIVSGIPIARFPTVEHISKGWSFLVMTSWLFKKVMTSQRKLYMVWICSTVGKWAKRMPDTIVETTACAL